MALIGWRWRVKPARFEFCAREAAGKPAA